MKQQKISSKIRRFFTRFGGGGVKALNVKPIDLSNGGGEDADYYKYSRSECVDVSNAYNFTIKLNQTTAKAFNILSGTELEIVGAGGAAADAIIAAAQQGKKYVYASRNSDVVVARILEYNADERTVVTDKFRIAGSSVYVYLLNKIYPYTEV